MKKAGIAAVVVALAVVAAPAQAEKLGTEGGLTYVKTTNPLKSKPQPASMNALAVCPDGTVPTGGGSNVSGRPSDPVLAGSTFQNGAPGWETNAWHDAGDSNRKVSSWAICTKKTSKVDVYQDLSDVQAGPAPGIGISGCNTPEQHIVGGGVEGTGPATGWAIVGSRPFDSDTDVDQEPDDEWLAILQRQAGAGPAEVAVRSVCMEGPTPSYVLKKKTTADGFVTLTAKCPNNKSVSGGGVYFGGFPDDAVATTSKPIDDGDKGKVPDDGWETTMYNFAVGAQSFDAYAICI